MLIFEGGGADVYGWLLSYTRNCIGLLLSSSILFRPPSPEKYTRLVRCSINIIIRLLVAVKEKTMQHPRKSEVLTSMHTHTICSAVTIFCMVILHGIQAQDSSRDEHGADSGQFSALSIVHNNHTYIQQGKPVYLNSINTKAVSDFKRRYNDVDNELWQKTDKGFIATFKKDGISWIIGYDEKGRWKSSVKGYTEDKMLFEVRDMVKKTYYDFNIIHVDEIETNLSNGVPTYLVYLHYKNETKIVRIKENEMTVWQEMKRL